MTDREYVEASTTKHTWVFQRAGGNPANAESYEWVRYCSVCGMEDTCEDEELPPCEGVIAPETEAGSGTAL
jgi:hypothetical protein